ncbi:hypothetical protein V6N12_065607 [Hibiscus sabdariffa]|uniref:Uncharacterized protein n=1 Tax=Hibiscus sabdariffa TaxID=183260 RepID=A0ABR2G975_9ROSI
MYIETDFFQSRRIWRRRRRSRWLTDGGCGSISAGAGVGEEDGGDLVGAEVGAWPRAQPTMRAERSKQATALAIVNTVKLRKLNKRV